MSPALERYRREALEASLWKRPQLSPRDRSIVTIAALIARNQTAEQAHYLAVALDNGVRPSEISEIITHLAFYAGWGNAMATVQIAQGVFDTRGIARSALPPAAAPLLPLDQAAEAQRAALVERPWVLLRQALWSTPRDVLFKDLWLRPALAAANRSLVTVSALIASGQVAQVTYHLNRAMDSGLTQRRSRRGDHAPRLLRRMAERVLRRTRGERRLRQAPALTHKESAHSETAHRVRCHRAVDPVGALGGHSRLPELRQTHGDAPWSSRRPPPAAQRVAGWRMFTGSVHVTPLFETPPWRTGGAVGHVSNPARGRGPQKVTFIKQ